MSADVFEAELLHSKALQQLALSYVQAMITQMSQSILCIGHHAVSERLCYWLLFNGDALPEEPIKITHEMIAHMLGVRRESVTQALGKLQTAGLVSSGRGKIAILDREGLSQQVCECFSLVTAEKQRLYERALRMISAESESPQSDDALSAPDARLLQKYQDAYDFAPVGFVNLDEQCQVVHTNLAGAIMLGVQRSSRSKHSFLSFISAEDHERFLAFHQSVLSGKCRDHLEVTLSGTGRRADMIVRIDGTLNDLGEECALVLIDVTRDKKLVTELLEHERQQHQDYSAKPSDMAWFNDKEGRVLAASSNLIDQFKPMTGQGNVADMDVETVCRRSALPHVVQPISGK
jgi:PAS domain-containing protein